MKLLGFEFPRREKAVVLPHNVSNTSALVSAWNGAFGTVRESFAGAWQRNITVEPRENLLTFSPVFAGVSLIAGDIAKLRLRLTERTPDGIWEEITDGATAFLPVIRKPNKYQTRAQFVSAWIVSKLLHGNTYVLKQRDDRSVVTSLYILDARMVTPLVTDDGDVYYRLQRDALSQVTETDTIVPASEIIHDRMLCLWHPLIGVSPLYGCGASATQGLRIQNNSDQFFANMSRPSGILTAPAKISDEAAKRLKDHWEANFSGSNIGKIAVLGDGLTYEAMTIPAQQAQLIEQLKHTIEDVARVLHIPLHMLQVGQAPALASVGAINQLYYSQALQSLINDLEDCYTEGLGLDPWSRSVEFDLTDLQRLDPLSRAETSQKAVGAGYMTPNEARAQDNMPPIEGGDSGMMQQQVFSLQALAKRDAADPFSKPEPAPAATPATQGPSGSPEVQATPAKQEADAATQTRELIAGLRKGLNV